MTRYNDYDHGPADRSPQRGRPCGECDEPTTVTPMYGGVLFLGWSVGCARCRKGNPIWPRDKQQAIDEFGRRDGYASPPEPPAVPESPKAAYSPTENLAAAIFGAAAIVGAVFVCAAALS